MLKRPITELVLGEMSAGGPLDLNSASDMAGDKSVQLNARIGRTRAQINRHRLVVDSDFHGLSKKRIFKRNLLVLSLKFA